MPIVDILPRHILGEAVTLPKRTFELIALAVDLVELVIGKLAPFLLDLAFGLFPSMRFQSISWRILAIGISTAPRAARFQKYWNATLWN